MKSLLRTKRRKIAAIVAPLALAAGVLLSIGLLHAAETASDPQPIASSDELREAVQKNPKANLYLTNDVDMNGYDGSSTLFQGTLDGDGWSLVHLGAPLFGTVDGAVVKNFALEKSDVPGYLFREVRNGSEISNIRLLAFTQVAYGAGAEGSGMPARVQPLDEHVSIGGLVQTLTGGSHAYSIFNFGGDITGNLVGELRGATLSNVLMAQETKYQYGVTSNTTATYSAVKPSIGAPLVGKLSGDNTVRNIWLEGVTGPRGSADIAAVFGGDTGENGTLTAEDITIKNIAVTSTDGKAAGIAVNLRAGSAQFTRLDVTSGTISGAAGASAWFANAPEGTVTVESGRVVSSTITASAGQGDGFAPGGVALRHCFIADSTVTGTSAYLAGRDLTSFTGCVYAKKGTVANITGGTSAGLTEKQAADLAKGTVVAELGHGGEAGAGWWSYLSGRYPYPVIPLSGYQDWDTRLLMVTNNARRGAAADKNFGWDRQNQVYGPLFSMRRSYIFVTEEHAIDFSSQRGMIQWTYNKSCIGGTTAGVGSNTTEYNKTAQGFASFTGLLDGNSKVIRKPNNTLIGRMDGGGIRDLGVASSNIVHGNVQTLHGNVVRYGVSILLDSVFLEGQISADWHQGMLVAGGNSIVYNRCFVNGDIRINDGAGRFGGSQAFNVTLNTCYGTGIDRFASATANIGYPLANGAINGSYGSTTRQKITKQAFAASAIIDMQAAAYKSGTNAKTTAQMLTGGVMGSSSDWTYEDGLYPQLTVFATSDNPYIVANSRVSALPLPLAGQSVTVGETEKAMTSQTVGQDLPLMTAFPGEPKGTIVWTSTGSNLISADGTTLRGATATEGEYTLTATYTDPVSKATASKRFQITVARPTELTGQIEIIDASVVMEKFPRIRYIGGNSDGKGTLRVYKETDCQNINGKWTPNAGATPVKTVVSTQLNHVRSSIWIPNEFQLTTAQFQLGDRFVATYESGPDDVRGGFVSAISAAIQPVKDIADENFKLYLIDATTGKETDKAVAGRSIRCRITPVPAGYNTNADCPMHVLLILDENGNTIFSETSAYNAYVIPKNAVTVIHRYTASGGRADANIYGYKGVIERRYTVTDGETMTGAVQVTTPQYEDNIPRVGKRIQAIYDKAGALPDTGSDGKFEWQYLAKGATDWVAVDEKLVVAVTIGGKPGCYLFAAADSEGGQYRVRYKASTNGGVKGETAWGETAAVQKPPVLNGEVSIILDSGESPPMVDKTVFRAAYADGPGQQEDVTKGTFQWGYSGASGFVGFQGATGTTYTLRGSDYALLVANRSYLKCRYTPHAESSYNGEADGTYMVHSYEAMRPFQQTAPGTAAEVTTTDTYLKIKLEENMAYVAVPKGTNVSNPDSLDWQNSLDPQPGALEIKDGYGYYYKGISRNRTYTLYKRYPNRPGYIQSPMSASCGDYTTKKTSLPTDITIHGAPNKDGTLSVTVKGAIANSYKVDWQVLHSGAAEYVGIPGKTGVAQDVTANTYTLKLTFGDAMGLKEGDTVRARLVPEADFQNNPTSPTVGPLTATLSITNERELQHIGLACTASCPADCRFAGLSAADGQKHAYRQSQDIACAAQWTPVTLAAGGSYDGAGNRITGLRNPVFATLSGGARDLLLMKPATAGNGALANTVSGSAAVSGVLVIEPAVTATGAAGGLIGTLSGGSVQSSAVIAGTVTANGGAAGGLVGAYTGGTLSGCYAAQTTATGTSANALIGSGSATPSNSYFDTQTCRPATDAKATGLTIAGLTADGGPAGFTSGWNLKKGYYPLPTALYPRDQARLYAAPLVFQGNDTIAGARTTIPLTMTSVSGGAITYTVKSGAATLVESGQKLWLHGKGSVTLTAVYGAASFSREITFTVAEGQGSVQTLTITANESGEQTLPLTGTTLYEALMDDGFYRQTGADFTSSATGLALGTEAALRDNLHIYGTTNANKTIFVGMTGNNNSAHQVHFRNAAAYSLNENRYFELKTYRDSSHTIYDLIRVTLQPMTSRKLDITVPVSTAATIAPDKAEQYTQSYSNTLTVVSKANAPLTVTLSRVTPGSGAPQLREVGAVAWGTTKESILESGVALEIANLPDRSEITPQPYRPTGSSQAVFAKLGYQQQVSFRLRLWHPKLVKTAASYNYTLTYQAVLSADDIALS